MGVVAQWQSTGGLSQRPSVRFPAAPLFFLSLCCFKGLRTVTTQIISIGLRTYVSPIYQAPYAVMKLKFFRNQKHTQQLVPINIFRYIQKSMKSAIFLCSHTLGVADSYPGGHTHTHTHTQTRSQKLSLQEQAHWEVVVVVFKHLARYSLRLRAVQCCQCCRS